MLSVAASVSLQICQHAKLEFSFRSPADDSKEPLATGLVYEGTPPTWESLASGWCFVGFACRCVRSYVHQHIVIDIIVIITEDLTLALKSMLLSPCRCSCPPFDSSSNGVIEASICSALD